MVVTPTVRDKRPTKICDYQLPRSVARDFPGIGSCERRAVTGETNCWLHLDEVNKPEKEIAEALDDSCTNAGLILRNVDMSRRDITLSDRQIPGGDFREAKLDGVDFRGSVIAYSDFSGASLVDAEFQNGTTNLIQCCFDETNCTRTNFSNSEMNNVSFVNSVVDSASFCDSRMDHADFTGVEARSTKFIDSHLPDTHFTDANLRRAKFQNSHLADATFQGANIYNANFTDADTFQIDFRGVVANHTTIFGNQSIYEQRADEEIYDKLNREPPQDNESYYTRLERSFHRGFVRLYNGDELLRTNQLNRAVDTYRTYQQVFRENSIPELVRRYEIQERDADRKYRLAEGQYLAWLRLSASQKLFLYSFSPVRPLFWSLIIIAIFSILFPLFGFEYNGTTYNLCVCFEPKQILPLISRSTTASIQIFLPGASPESGFADLEPWLVNVEATLGTLALSLFVFTLGQRVRH